MWDCYFCQHRATVAGPSTAPVYALRHLPFLCCWLAPPPRPLPCLCQQGARRSKHSSLIGFRPASAIAPAFRPLNFQGTFTRPRLPSYSRLSRQQNPFAWSLPRALSADSHASALSLVCTALEDALSVIVSRACQYAQSPLQILARVPEHCMPE